jgi:hypothetical protein
MRPSAISVLVAALLGWASHVAVAQPDARAAAHYRQAADVFELLDNVSNWWPGYSDARYREYWVRTFGLSAEDDSLLARYARLRERHFDKTGQSNEDPATSEGGLFTARSTLHADPVGDVFLRSETIGEALDHLAGVVNAEELAFLHRFYPHFASRYLPLVIEHQRAVQASLAATNRTLTSAAFGDWIAEIERFFDVSAPEARYEALYVWWPDSLNVVANPRGRFLVLRAMVKPGEALNVADVVAHEAVHVIAAQQSSDRKRTISNAFLRGCPVNASVGRLNTFEEPIAVVFGNMAFTRAFRPERYRFAKRWYGDAWVDLYAKLLFSPVVDRLEQGGRLADGVVDQAVQLCAALLAQRGAQAPGR